jgi:hypothetical protein
MTGYSKNQLGVGLAQPVRDSHHMPALTFSNHSSNFQDHKELEGWEESP